MYITRPKRTSSNGKTYETILLRESYREEGKVKNRTIANFTHCNPADVAIIELALKHKDNLANLLSTSSSSETITLREGLSVGAVWAIDQVAQRVGIKTALGKDFQGQLALYQIMARLIEQGSRLSAVRLAKVHALPDVLGMTQGFSEDHLYENLQWLSERQEIIEQSLFATRRKNRKTDLFLYDVTSSYLEGQHNELAAYGYNRDQKKGKKQIVVGLLCDEEGDPVSVQVFEGNTQDTQTFSDQIKKVAERFHCPRVTFVGDRGMIKSLAIEELTAQGFHYITAITKPQIKTLMKRNVIQLEFFDENLCEVEDDGVRYILRRNPERVELLARNRADKHKAIEALLAEKNAYLQDHPKADETVARQKVEMKIARLKLSPWMRVTCTERNLKLEWDEAALAEATRLDGCYVLRTDLSEEAADRQTIHSRYKELSEVEWAFRTSKTGHLELRPIHVRKEESTRGHVFIVMLAYLIRRELEKAWSGLDVTVEEGLKQLSTLCTMEIEIQGKGTCHQIPEPREQSQALLQALNIRMPHAIPRRSIRVVTKKKLPNQRNSR